MTTKKQKSRQRAMSSDPVTSTVQAQINALNKEKADLIKQAALQEKKLSAVTRELNEMRGSASQTLEKYKAAKANGENLTAQRNELEQLNTTLQGEKLSLEKTVHESVDNIKDLNSKIQAISNEKQELMNLLVSTVDTATEALDEANHALALCTAVMEQLGNQVQAATNRLSNSEQLKKRAEQAVQHKVRVNADLEQQNHILRDQLNPRMSSVDAKIGCKFGNDALRFSVALRAELKNTHDARLTPTVMAEIFPAFLTNGLFFGTSLKRNKTSADYEQLGLFTKKSYLTSPNIYAFYL